MPLFSSGTSVKVALRDPQGGDHSAVQETRRVPLPAGNRTRLVELLALLEERFGRPLARALTYADADGEMLSVSTDAELCEALAAGAERFEVAAAAAVPEDEDEWELVKADAPERPAAPIPDDVPWRSEIRFWVNGEEVVVSNPSPAVTLLEWLRESKGLTGTHVGCLEGGCGICTVNLTQKDPSTGKLRQVPINSCLRRLCALDGCHVITTEGIGCQKSGLHSVQSAIANGNGSQCGFCTPGWVMGMYSLLERNKTPTREEVERHFDGNLCRCTGYRPILTAFGAFAKGGDKCGKHASVPHPPGVLAHTAEPLHFKDAGTGEEWFRPLSMEQFAEVIRLAQGRRLRPLCASTSDGVAKYYVKRDFSADGTVFVDITCLPELHGVRPSTDGIEFGATTTIEQVIESLEQAKDAPSFVTLAEHMRRVASVQIRSVASWAGNLMLTRDHPSFASDMATILSGAGASFEVQLPSGPSRLSVQELLAAEGDVLVISMRVPKLPPGSLFQTFKAAPRSTFSHAYVNFAAYISFDAGTHAVAESRIFLGGACKTLFRAQKTEAALHGHKLDQAVLGPALAALRAEIAANASPDLRSSPGYREQLATGFLYKTFLAATGSSEALPTRYASAVDPFVQMVARPISSGTESFGTDPSEAPIGQYVPKRSAEIQASGEAAYPSDYGGRGALYGQLVLSTAARAKLVALDPSEALSMPGVHDFISASAVPGKNCTCFPAGGEALKEKVFFEVNDVVPCIGAVLGLVVADSWRQARDAARRVQQRYANVGPIVGTIEEAEQLRRTVPGGEDGGTPTAVHLRGARPHLAAGVEHGDVMAEVVDGLRTLKGTFKTGGQKHFYMETQAVCVTPFDGNRWEVICSDQDANLTQACVAAVLALPMHDINVKVPRAGGAFGGKLTRQLLNACAAAVAANKLRCPVRVQNERSDDMQLIGGRQPMNFDYEVTFDDTGRVDAMKLAMTIDAGWVYTDTKDCLAMAVGWSDNCYQYRSFKVTTQAAITDTSSNTPVRAPGCMQSILAAEVVMEHIAKTVGKPVEEVQALNFYRMGESPTTPFGDHLGKDGYNWTIPTLWSQIQSEAQFAQRQAAVTTYNAANRWRKKGIAISPAKYVMDISTAAYSSGALVCIYADGTVLVSSGGSEVGQGLSTKVALCVAEALGAPFEKVQVGPRETSKVPDNTCTGGSGTSECSAQAAILACKKLLPLLEKYRTGGKKWEDAVAAAVADKVGLMASGWYGAKNAGSHNTYSTYGTAVSEVEIDALTGEVRVDRVDVLMDLGNQLDAAVDLGQVQGGFVIALGYLLTEQLKVDSSGMQLHLGTWDYKIPGAYDIPVEFNVALLKDSPNPVGVKGSKGSAEPAMCLMPSVYLAVKHAIYEARKEVGLGDAWFMLNTPLTPEAIRLAVGVPEAQLDVPPQ